MKINVFLKFNFFNTNRDEICERQDDNDDNDNKLKWTELNWTEVIDETVESIVVTIRSFK